MSGLRHAGSPGVQTARLRDLAWKRWQSSAPFPTAAATAAETSFSCGPALTENLRTISEVHSRNHVRL